MDLHERGSQHFQVFKQFGLEQQICELIHAGEVERVETTNALVSRLSRVVVACNEVQEKLLVQISWQLWSRISIKFTDLNLDI